MKARVVGGLVFATIISSIFGGTIAVYAQEQSAGEAAGAGRLSREVETPPAVICGGCVSPTFATQGKGVLCPTAA